MLDVLILAFGVGLAFNAAPGAVTAESVRRGIRGGFRPALGVQVGSLVGDGVWAVLGLAGVGALVAVPAVRVPVALAGCAVLAWLGVAGLREALRPSTSSAVGPLAAPAEARWGPSLRAGAALSLGNPWNVVYWSGVAGAVAAALGERPTVIDLAVFLAGFMAASLAWCLVMATVIAAMHRALPPVAARILEGVSGVVLLALAVAVLVRLL